MWSDTSSCTVFQVTRWLGGGWRGRQNLCKNVTTALSRRLACQCETFSQFEFNELLMVTFCCPMSPSRLIGRELFIFPHDDKQTDGTFSDISNCPQQSNNCLLPAGRKRIGGVEVYSKCWPVLPGSTLRIICGSYKNVVMINSEVHLFSVSIRSIWTTEGCFTWSSIDVSFYLWLTVARIR